MRHAGYKRPEAIRAAEDDRDPFARFRQRERLGLFGDAKDRKTPKTYLDNVNVRVVEASLSGPPPYSILIQGGRSDDDHICLSPRQVEEVVRALSRYLDQAKESWGRDDEEA